MKKEASRGGMGVLVDMIDPFRIQRGGAAFQAVDFVAFVEKEFG